MAGRETPIVDIQPIIEEQLKKCPVCGGEMESMTWPWAMCCPTHGDLMIRGAKIVDGKLHLRLHFIVPLS